MECELLLVACSMLGAGEGVLWLTDLKKQGSIP